MLRVCGVMSVIGFLALPFSGQADPQAVPGEPEPHHGAHHGGVQTGDAGFAAADTASTEAFRAANAKMHAAMEIPYTGDADVDFLRGMIAHHEGAIAMAQVVLRHGLDPEVKALAETILTTQEKEITTMKALLAQFGF